MQQQNPLLSEFNPYHWLRKALRNPTWLAGIWALLVIVAIILGHLSGANCHCADIISPNQPDKKRVTVIYGFLAELNHGPMYLVGGSLLIFLGIRFLNHTNTVFQKLADDRRLLVRNETGFASTGAENRARIDQFIGQLNSWCSYLIIFGATWVCLVIIVGTEVPAANKKWFGWVQSAQIEQIHQHKLSNMDRPEVTGVETNFPGIPRDELVVTFRNYPDQETREQFAYWFPGFLIYALVLESILLAFGVWLGFKVVFTIWLLAWADWISELPNCEPGNNLGDVIENKIQAFRRWCSQLGICKAEPTLALRFDTEDPNHRFRIGELDTVYNHMLWFGIISAINFTFGQLSNVAKGTCWSVSHDPLFVGRPLLAAFTIAPVLLICFFPIFRGVWLTSRAKKLRLRLLDGQYAKLGLEPAEPVAADPQKKEEWRTKVDEWRAQILELDRRKIIVMNNQCWPLANSLSMTLAVGFLVVMLTAFPVALQLFGFFISDQKYIETITFLSQKLPRYICNCEDP
jgi:hypothetical protein